MKKNIFWLIILSVIISCKDTKKDEELIKNNDKVVNNNQLLKGWCVFAEDSIKVNLPSNWKPKKIKDALLYVPLDNNNKDLYYVILNYNTTKINCKDYIKETFNQVSKKDLKFNYILKKIDLQNINECYIMEFYTVENKIKYKIFSLIYQEGNQLYDFSYKTLDVKKNNIKNYQTFYSVLFSFEYNYDNIIDSQKIIVKNEKELKYEDL